jgi:hypothetical protein
VRLARFSSLFLALLVALAVAGAACSGEGASSLPTPKPGFCEAAQRYDHRVERGAPLAEQITILEKMARNAPKDVASDTNLFLASLQKLQGGDKSVVDNPKVEAAVKNVERRAQNGCDFFRQEPGSGM